jgi:hypothetical protein
MADEACVGLDLNTLQMQQIDPSLNLERVGAKCVRVAESKLSGMIDARILEVPAADPHFIEIYRQSTCKKISIARESLGCNENGVMIQKAFTESCDLGMDRCTHESVFIDYVIRPVPSDASRDGAAGNRSGCLGPESAPCEKEPTPLAVIYLTKCECEKFVNVIGFVNSAVMTAESDWHYPQLGLTSVKLICLQFFLSGLFLFGWIAI